MTDKQMYKELEKFANECTVARDIKVTISHYSTHFEPRPPAKGMKYEDTIYLHRLLDGATAYLYWKRRKYVNKNNK